MYKWYRIRVYRHVRYTAFYVQHKNSEGATWKNYRNFVAVTLDNTESEYLKAHSKAEEFIASKVGDKVLGAQYWIEPDHTTRYGLVAKTQQ